MKDRELLFHLNFSLFFHLSLLFGKYHNTAYEKIKPQLCLHGIFFSKSAPETSVSLPFYSHSFWFFVALSEKISNFFSEYVPRWK